MPFRWAAQSLGRAETDGYGLALAQPSAAHDRLALQPVACRFAVHVVHHEVVGAAFSIDVIDPDKVGMLDGGGGLGLADETPHEALHLGGVQTRGRDHDLHRNVHPQPQMPPAVDRSHAALPDLLIQHDATEDFISLDNGHARHERIGQKIVQRHEYPRSTSPRS